MANFYNENRNRTYPFVGLTAGVRTPVSGLPTMRQLPHDWIVDCGFILGPLVEYDPTLHQVWLQRIARSGSEVEFEFQSDAPGLVGLPLVFTRLISDDDYAMEVVDGPVQPSSQSLSCEPLSWTGYLVTGNMGSVSSRLADGQQIVASAGDALVEPALLQSTNRTLVTSVNLANDDRTRVTAPDDCDGISWPHPVDVLHVAATCLDDTIHWREGFNCMLRQDGASNSLLISAGVGLGRGEPCEELPLFPGESQALDSTNDLLSGGPLCSETIRSINGQGGPLFEIEAGQGVSLELDVPNNTVIVDVNMIDLMVCEVSQSL